MSDRLIPAGTAERIRREQAEARERGRKQCERIERRPSQELLRPENFLEVGFTPDEREIIINYPVDLATIAAGAGHLVFSPAQARNLAKILLRKAEECKP